MKHVPQLQYGGKQMILQLLFLFLPKNRDLCSLRYGWNCKILCIWKYTGTSRKLLVRQSVRYPACHVWPSRCFPRAACLFQVRSVCAGCCTQRASTKASFSTTLQSSSHHPASYHASHPPSVTQIHPQWLTELAFLSPFSLYLTTCN